MSNHQILNILYTFEKLIDLVKLFVLFAISLNVIMIQFYYTF